MKMCSHGGCVQAQIYMSKPKIDIGYVSTHYFILETRSLTDLELIIVAVVTGPHSRGLPVPVPIKLRLRKHEAVPTF